MNQVIPKTALEGFLGFLDSRFECGPLLSPRNDKLSRDKRLALRANLFVLFN